MQQQPAAEGSLAEQEQQIAMALFGFLNSPKTKQDRQTLAAKLREWNAEEADDQLIISELGKVKPGPLSIVLPARFFRGKIPLLGLRRKMRMALVALPLLLLGITGWWLGRPGEGYEPDRVYALEQLELSSTRDTARALVHNALAKYGTGGTNQERKKEFYEASLMDLDYKTAGTNWVLSVYQDAVELHKDHAYQAARDSLEKLFRMPNSSDTAFSLFSYIKIVTSLQLDSVEDVLNSFPVFCEQAEDRPYLRRFLDSIKQENRFIDLLQRRLNNFDLNRVFEPNRARAAQAMLDIRDCMVLFPKPSANSEDQLSRPNILNTRLIDNSTMEPVRGAEVLLPGGDFAVISDEDGLVHYRFPEKPQTSWLDLGVRAEGYPTKAYRFNVYADSTFPQVILIDKARPNSGNLQVKMSDSSGCVPFTVTLIASADKPVEEYNWFVTNNLRRSGKEIEYEFQTAGFYTVLLAVRYADGTRDTLADIPDITVLKRGEGKILHTAVLGYPLQIDFLARVVSDDIPTWDYGDGVTGFGRESQHSYQKPGRYTVRLSYTGPCGTETVEEEITVGKTEIPIPEVVFVKGGEFMMGSEGGGGNEKPVHKVRVSDFYMGNYEVTNEEFAAFLHAKGNQEEEGKTWYDPEGSFQKVKARIQEREGRWEVEQGYERHPVIYVNWYGARAYATWLSEQTGQRWKLPTEAEWEYAAGGGSGADSASTAALRTTYAGTNDESKLGDYAWYDSNSKSQTHPAGQKRPNRLGLYDMSGNVWEWCRDWYDADYYANSALANPTGPQNGNLKVVRGGSWVSYDDFSRVAGRVSDLPLLHDVAIGFRLCRYSQN